MLPYTQTALIADSYKYIPADGSYDYYPFGEYMPGRYATGTASNCITTTLDTLVHGFFDHFMSYADMSGLAYSEFGTITEFDTTAPVAVIIIGYRKVDVEGATIGVSEAAKNGMEAGGFKQFRSI